MEKSAKFYTQTQIAKRLGVSKSTVYRLIKANQIHYDRRQGQSMLYSEATVEKLQALRGGQQSAAAETRKTDDESASELVKVLQQTVNDLQSDKRQLNYDKQRLYQELANKDHYIERLEKQTDQLQGQLLQLKAPSEATGSHQSDPSDMNEQSYEKSSEAPKRPWWQRLLGL